MADEDGGGFGDVVFGGDGGGLLDHNHRVSPAYDLVRVYTHTGDDRCTTTQ